MSERELPPLPADVRDLLARADVPEPPAGLEDRIWSQVSAGAGLDSPAANAPAAPASPAAPMGALHAALGKWGVISTLAALAVGGAGGAVVRGAIDAKTERAPASVIASAEPSSHAPAPSASAAPKIVDTLDTVDAGAPPAASKPPAVGSKATRRDVDLAEEQSLLETARSAILRREPRLALAPLREHGQRFPRGHLSEERDGLWVQALANAGDTSAARSKATEFRRKYPQSLLLPAVEAAVESFE